MSGQWKEYCEARDDERNEILKILRQYYPNIKPDSRIVAEIKLYIDNKEYVFNYDDIGVDFDRLLYDYEYDLEKGKPEDIINDNLMESFNDEIKESIKENLL